MQQKITQILPVKQNRLFLHCLQSSLYPIFLSLLIFLEHRSPVTGSEQTDCLLQAGAGGGGGGLSSIGARKAEYGLLLRPMSAG